MEKAKICPACGDETEVIQYRRLNTPNYIVEPLDNHDFYDRDNPEIEHNNSSGKYLLSIESPDKKTIHRITEHLISRFHP